MSLKAKIEAVIYASEEPVTLAQLVGLLGEEAQAELDRTAAEQQSLELLADEGAGVEGEPASDAAAEPESAEAGAAEGQAPFESAQTDAAFAEDAGASEAQTVPGGEGDAVVPSSEAPAGDAEAPAEAAAAAAPDADAVAAAAAKAEKAKATRLRAHFRAVLDTLVQEYATGDRGLEIREVGGGFRFATKPEYHDAVRGFVKSLKPPLKLSLQALETLAVVAYKQPVTAPEISEIRGVDSGGVLGSLISRKLITTAGRKQVIGRPILYKTTKEFLLKFGLKDVGELPSIEEFEKMAGQMAEQEEIPMEGPRDHDAPESAEELEPEKDAYAPQADGDSSAADNVSEETGDKASIDGRISSLPPDYAGEELRDDPSAEEAEIQSGE